MWSMKTGNTPIVSAKYLIQKKIATQIWLFAFNCIIDYKGDWYLKSLLWWASNKNRLLVLNIKVGQNQHKQLCAFTMITCINFASKCVVECTSVTTDADCCSGGTTITIITRSTLATEEQLPVNDSPGQCWSQGRDAEPSSTHMWDHQDEPTTFIRWIRILNLSCFNVLKSFIKVRSLNF